MDDIFTEKRLKELSLLAEKYQHAEPFSHVVIDDFLPPNVLEKVLAEFPSPNEKWIGYEDASQHGKVALEDYWTMPEFTRFVFAQLNTGPFLSFLETLTGIPGLISDPHLRGGGLHMTKPGGWLDIHVDFNFYKRMKVYRRINVLIFLNKNWKDENGGQLELWNDDMTKCFDKVIPVFNRCVIFTPSENAHHGHPEPVKGSTNRKSMAWYYYTSEPASEDARDTTSHPILFKESPATTLKGRVHGGDFIPPIFGKIARATKKRLGL